MKSTRKCFIIFFAISLGIMVIIFYGSITFAQVYRGGVLDLIAGALWTFIFLQIIPFLLCLVLLCSDIMVSKKINKYYMI